MTNNEGGNEPGTTANAHKNDFSPEKFLKPIVAVLSAIAALATVIAFFVSDKATAGRIAVAAVLGVLIIAFIASKVPKHTIAAAVAATIVYIPCALGIVIFASPDGDDRDDIGGGETTTSTTTSTPPTDKPPTTPPTEKQPLTPPTNTPPTNPPPTSPHLPPTTSTTVEPVISTMGKANVRVDGTGANARMIVSGIQLPTGTYQDCRLGVIKRDPNVSPALHRFEGWIDKAETVETTTNHWSGLEYTVRSFCDQIAKDWADEEDRYNGNNNWDGRRIHIGSTVENPTASGVEQPVVVS
jgi:hypothetical protein